MPLFEVAIIEKPTKRQAEEGVLERLVTPTAILVVAKDIDTARILAAKSVADLNPERSEVLARPF